MGKELKFLFTSKCLAISLPTNPHIGKDLSFLPPKYVAILDHMGKESSFLPRSASFPSFSPKCNPYPSPQILSHLYVGKDSPPPSKSKIQNPHKSFLYLHFSFYFYFIYFIASIFFFFSVFFPKTWNSPTKWKNYSPAFGANNRRIDAPVFDR